MQTLHAETRPGHPHLVFSHALGATSAIWANVVDKLPAPWGVTTYDLRGHGRSGGMGPRLRTHSDDLVALAPYGAWLVGLSIGGQIAMQAALDAPGRFAGLILCDTAPRIGSPDYYAARATRIRAEGMAPFAAEQVKRWFAPAFLKAHPNRVAMAGDALAAQPVEGYVAACAAIGATDLTDQLAKLDVPVLCVGGAEDVSTPPATIHALAAALPQAEARILDGVGHMPPIEAPDRLADAVVEFITRRHPTS